MSPLMFLILLAIGTCNAFRYTLERNDLHDFESPAAKTASKKSLGLFRKFYAKDKDLNLLPTDLRNAGEPLFLTPLIRANKIKEALTKSRVSMGHRHGHSFAGYFTVNENYNSNLFFWFFSARSAHQSAPVIIWLQGGPGASSLFGLFTENGPFSIDEKMHLIPRNYSWNNKFHVLYIDNPVGTGFSFTDSDAGYAKNEADVGTDLYNLMTQFYQLFPELQKNKLFITGESYAGKYVPALAYTIHKMNPSAKLKMNLQGVAIGDGMCDPVSMTGYGDLLYQIGLLDAGGRAFFHKQEASVIKYIQKKQFTKAFQVFDQLLNGDKINAPSYFYNMTGLTNYYNFLEDSPKDMDYWRTFINQAKVRKQIHVGNLTFNSGMKVETFLESDIMQSVKPWIEELADHYDMLFYNGQLDIIIAYPLTESFLNTLNWKYSKEFQSAKRIIWKVDGEVAGYVKEVPKFAFVLIRKAGHMVPYDQPKWAYEMISRFTKYNK